MTAPKEVQEQVFFVRQIQLSKELDLPFVVHTRDALEDTYEIIKSEGVVHVAGLCTPSQVLWIGQRSL